MVILNTLNIDLNSIHLFDYKTNAFTPFSLKTFEMEVEKLKKNLELFLSKFEDVNGYDLDNIQVNVGVSGNLLVIGAHGGITLTFSKIRSEKKA